MGIVEMAVIAVLLFVTVEQAIAVAIFLLYCRRRPQLPPDAELPAVLVILALRGCDATLGDCLHALFRQRYPRYRVRVMVDNYDDPSWEIARQAVDDAGVQNVEIQTLKSPGSTCTLKCSALLQATADLPEEVDVVAFLDADVAPSETWLRELIGPLATPGIEASMGNRWYSPRLGWWGSLSRYLWNTSAVVNMFFWQVPWGGTLAVKANVLRESRLRDLWSRAGCDDVPLFRVLQQRRSRLVFVPTLLLPNLDDCTLSNGFRFITRQLLWVRLYHPVCWWICAFFHLILLAAQIGAVVGVVSAIWGSDWNQFAVYGGALAANLLGIGVMLAGLERYAESVSGEPVMRPPNFWRKVVFAIPFTEFVSLAAMAQAIWQRQVEWRGITYQVRGPWRIQMLEYRPSVRQLVRGEVVQPVGMRIGALAGIAEESHSGV
jgi:hypothetical protein